MSDKTASVSFRDRVRLTLDGEDPVLGRSISFGIMGLITLSIISFTVETIPGLPDWLRDILHVEEMIVLGCFTVEYLLRLWSARRPLGYVFSFWGLIDLAAILPSLVLAGADTRSLRIFRMLRLLRLLKLMRYVSAANRLGAAFEEMKEELVLYLILSVMVLYVCAAGIYFFEHEAQPEAFASIPHSLWWAVATLTTVGYGDVYPITAGGRIFTALVLMIGLGIVAVPTGLIATALSRQTDATDERAEKAEDGAPSGGD